MTRSVKRLLAVLAALLFLLAAAAAAELTLLEQTKELVLQLNEEEYDELKEFMEELERERLLDAGINPDAQDYVVNVSSRKFHLPTCSSVGKIKPENRSDFSGTRDDLIEMNFQPCGSCKP